MTKAIATGCLIEEPVFNTAKAKCDREKTAKSKWIWSRFRLQCVNAFFLVRLNMVQIHFLFSPVHFSSVAMEQCMTNKRVHATAHRAHTLEHIRANEKADTPSIHIANSLMLCSERLIFGWILFGRIRVNWQNTFRRDTEWIIERSEGKLQRRKIIKFTVHSEDPVCNDYIFRTNHTSIKSKEILCVQNFTETLSLQTLSTFNIYNGKCICCCCMFFLFFKWALITIFINETSNGVRLPP